MKNLILTLIITLPLTLWGQGWEQTYGGIGGWSVQQTTDGGYIVTGTTDSNGNVDVYLIKTDGNGNEQWSRTFGGSEVDNGRSVQQTTDGGYIITGSTLSFGSGLYELYLIKTDGNGNEVWSQTYGDTIHNYHGNSIQQTNDGGYIITGYRIGSNDPFLLKVDISGNEIWSTVFLCCNDLGNSVLQNSDGDYIVTTYGRLIKVDGSGNEIWSQMFGQGIGNYIFSKGSSTNDGGYIITGSSYNVSESDVLLIKTDENGIEQWTKTYGGIYNDGGSSVQQTQDGGYIITGETWSSSSLNNVNIDVYLIKTDGNGNEQWSRTFGGPSDDIGLSIQQTSDGGYIITGTYNGYGVYLIKTDDQGNITSTFEIPLPNSNRKIEKTVNLIGQEIKPQTNTPIIEIFDDGSVEKKIIVE